MSNDQILKLNNSLYLNKLVVTNNAIKAIDDNNGFQLVKLNSHITGKLTMLFNNLFGANGYSIVEYNN
jgi:hypothetical protein